MIVILIKAIGLFLKDIIIKMEIIIKKQQKTTKDQKWNRQRYLVFNEKNKKIAKFALGFWNKSNSLEILALQVKKQYQKQNIGSQIIVFIKKNYAQKTIWAFCNLTSLTFYAKQGFTFCLSSKKEKYLGKDKKTLLMSLSSQCFFIEDMAKVLKFKKVSNY